ncbi:MAG: IclR family transcriptional regulator [Spirochaetes bacterium]|nr:MAG: IclR family transcriptional regulator [Spirochaetota bacterium]
MQLLSSVLKSLKVLDLFTEEMPELSLTQISRLVNSHKSSVFRILNTLDRAGFLEKNKKTNKYRLGLKLVELANRVLNSYSLREIASSYMEELAEKTGEIIHLSILDGMEIVYLEKKGQGQPVTVGTKVGGRNPAYASAMGKVLLAGLPEQEFRELLGKVTLKKFTPNTISEVPDLIKELETVRKRGYAVDDEETFLGIRCVAAPIKDSEGKVVAAMSVTVPKLRMNKRRMRELRRLVIDTAQKISERSAGIKEGLIKKGS